MSDTPSATATAANITTAAQPPDPAASSNPTATIHAKYAQERAKRVRPDGTAQYLDLSTASPISKAFTADSWISYPSLSRTRPTLLPSQATQFLILGAGYGGLLFAVRLLQAGFPASSIRIVDAAGGFGGTWYWNRYPGLTCDVESYIYMPLLEEMGYIPKQRYASGEELRGYAELIAEKYDLCDKASFATEVRGMSWDDDDKRWRVQLRRRWSAEEGYTEDLCVTAQFVISTSGLLHFPQLPQLEGLGDFGGRSFHTSRWDYAYTGGSPEVPDLTKLKDKRVGIIGTGATAIQVVPELAKWSKHLTVFQRTPSAVDRRDNRPTDPETWTKDVATGKGWQRKRNDNFNANVTGLYDRPEVNIVDDAWSNMLSYSASVGGPAKGIVTIEKVPGHIQALHAADLARSERVRARVDEMVRDKDVAKSLKAWYPGWCKRPCFHDLYLDCFNGKNVTLVDTKGKGVDKLTTGGVVADGKEYHLDLLIFATGFRTPVRGSPALKANMTVTGRGGRSLEEKWDSEGVSTLHGVSIRGFPNFFVPGPLQAGATANQMFVLDQLSLHVAYVIAEASKMAGARTEKITIEPTDQAEQDWSMQILMRAAAFAGLSGCTPGYINAEAETDKPIALEEQMKKAKGAIWGEGIASYVNVIERWRDDGELRGLEIDF